MYSPQWLNFTLTFFGENLFFRDIFQFLSIVMIRHTVYQLLGVKFAEVT